MRLRERLPFGQMGFPSTKIRSTVVVFVCVLNSFLKYFICFSGLRSKRVILVN